MKNNLLPKLTAGYVSFGTMFYEPGNLAMISARAEKQLEDGGIDLIKTAPVFGEGAEPERAIRELKAKPWDFLIINIINWVDTRGVFRVLHEFRHEPMVLYSFGGFTDAHGRCAEGKHQPWNELGDLVIGALEQGDHREIDTDHLGRDQLDQPF